MRRTFFVLLALLIVFCTFQTSSAWAATQTEITEVTIGIAPADYKALVTESKKTAYDVYTKVGNGTYQNASINIRGFSSRIIGIETPAKRIPFELKFADRTAFSDGISNKSVKFISSLTPYRLIAEYLALELYDYAGIPTPAHTFTFVRFNNVDFGLYIAVEDLNKTFLNKWYGNTSHYLLKATSDGNKADRNIDSYRWFGNLFEKVGNDAQSIQRLLDALNSGSGYTPLINVDEWLRFFACIAVTGGNGTVFTELNNIALYNNNGKFELIPWDLSEAFSGMETDNGIDCYHVNSYVGNDSTNVCPLFELLMKSAENKTKYHRYIRELNEGFMKPELLEQRYNDILDALAPYLPKDSSIFLNSETTISELRGSNSTPPNNLLYTLHGIYNNLNAQLDGTENTFFKTEIDSGLYVSSFDKLIKYYQKHSPLYDSSLPKKIQKNYQSWAATVPLEIEPTLPDNRWIPICTLCSAAIIITIFSAIIIKRKKKKKKLSNATS